MKLKSFGCSFIYGNDLHRSDMGESWHEPSHQTWPAQIAKQLAVDYQCFANPGCGNLQVLNQVLNQAANEDDQTVYVIGWTWIERFDYVESNADDRTAWSTICPVSTNQVATNYYRSLHSEFKDKLTSLIYISTAINALTRLHIPFVMTYMDDLMFDQQWHAPASVCGLQDQIRPCMHNFNGHTFLEWSRIQGFEISKSLHPLHQAHAAAATYMVELVHKQFNLINPAQQ